MAKLTVKQRETIELAIDRAHIALDTEEMSPASRVQLRGIITELSELVPDYTSTHEKTVITNQWGIVMDVRTRDE